MGRSSRVSVLVVATVMALASCGGGASGHRAGRTRVTTTTTTTTATHPTTARPGAVPSPEASCIAETPPEMARYLGLTLQQAEALAETQRYHVRVVGSDGTCRMVTQELDTGRVDLYLDHGIVTAAGMG